MPFLVDDVALAIGLGSTAVNFGLDMFGASQEQREAEQQAARQNKQLRQDWRYDNRIRRITNKQNRQDYRNAVANEANMRGYNDRLAISDWQYKTAMADYEYGNAMRQYAQSEKIYKQQLAFNNIAAAQAYEAEHNKLNEIKIGQAFQSQEMAIENLIEEGQAQARGQAGRSAAKTAQSITASYGRNIAILAESMESATRQTKMNLKKIDVEKMGADLNAEAQRMIRPERMPSLPKPEPLPIANITKPINIPKRPKPVAVSAGSSAGAYLGAIGSLATNALGAYTGARYKS